MTTAWTGSADADLKLRRGDIFMTCGATWLSRAIRTFTHEPWEPPTEVTHVGVIVEDGTLYTAMGVEALTVCVRHGLYDHYAGQKDKVAIARPLNLLSKELDAIAKVANTYVGRPYGYLKIAAHLLDWCLLGASFFRRLACVDQFPICSYVVAHAYSLGAGKSFGVEANSASPDDVWDFVRKRPDLFALIRPLKPIERIEGQLIRVR